MPPFFCNDLPVGLTSNVGSTFVFWQYWWRNDFISPISIWQSLKSILVSFTINTLRSQLTFATHQPLQQNTYIQMLPTLLKLLISFLKIHTVLAAHPLCSQNTIFFFFGKIIIYSNRNDLGKSDKKYKIRDNYWWLRRKKYSLKKLILNKRFSTLLCILLLYVWRVADNFIS